MTGPRSATSGLAAASLVLGILGLLMSLVVVGGVFALGGLLLGLLHLRRSSQSRAVAGWGIGLSAVALVVSVLIAAGLAWLVNEMTQRAASVDERATRWVGVSSPDITVTSLEGEEISLEDLRGRRVVLNFWATWCGPCVQEIPHFVRLASESSPDQVVVLGLSDEGRAVLEPFVRDHRITYPIVSLSGVDLPAPYGNITAFPTTYVIDRNGVIQFARVGYLDHLELTEIALAEHDHQGLRQDSPELEG